MDRESAKNILSAYRPNGADALDETFRPAIEFARRDPETTSWWKEQSGFDKAVAAAMDTLPRDPEGRERTLHLLELETAPQRPRSPIRFWRAGIGIAALLVLGIALFPVFGPHLGQDTTLPLRAETFSMAALADGALPLDRKGGTYEELTTWLAAEGGAVPPVLPPGLTEARAQGCRILPVADGDGSVSLLCFRKNGELIHLFVFEGAARSLLANVPNDWTTDGGWNYRKLDEANGQALALATRADPDWVERLL